MMRTHPYTSGDIRYLTSCRSRRCINISPRQGRVFVHSLSSCFVYLHEAIECRVDFCAQLWCWWLQLGVQPRAYWQLRAHTAYKIKGWLITVITWFVSCKNRRPAVEFQQSYRFQHEVENIRANVGIKLKRRETLDYPSREHRSQFRSHLGSFIPIIKILRNKFSKTFHI